MGRRIGIALLCTCLTLVFWPATDSSAGRGIRIKNNIIVQSKDGTPIVATLFLPADASRRHKVPAVLRTHGWGGHRYTQPDHYIRALVRHNYAVLTWDSRGFGDSGGAAHVGAPGYEVKDAKALISYLATLPKIKKDGPTDPRVGWIGESNAGGVQINTAAFDRRVDAIAPIVPWGALVNDLIPNRVPKQTWGELLYGGGLATAMGDGLDSPTGPQTGNFAPQIHRAEAELASTGQVSDEIRRWFAHKSTTIRSNRVKAPTLIIQGSIDTLFPLEDGFRNYLNLRRAGTPVKLLTFCNGHTLAGCSYPGGDSGYPRRDRVRWKLWEKRLLAWLNRYVKNRRGAKIGPALEWQAQDGYFYGARRFPLKRSHFVKGRVVTTGPLGGPGPGGGDGPADGNPAPDDEIGSSAIRKTILPAPKKRKVILGVPWLDLKLSVTGAQAHVYFELIDKGPKGKLVTVDDQTMPIEVGMGETNHRLKLHGVSWILKPGHSLQLEVTTGSNQYANPRAGAFEVEARAVPHLPVARIRHLRSHRTR
jgi:ABC-2 type transport system ATP-binding protein